MTDEQIVDLYWARDESAIAETSVKYGRYFHTIASNILGDDGDSEECVNDVYLKAWESMPDARPSRLGAYLGRITRNLALNRLKAESAGKRGGGRVAASLDELCECVSGGSPTDAVVDRIAFAGAMNGFLASLSREARGVFVARYFYFHSLAEIAQMYGIGENKAALSLFRSRKKLKKALEKEELF